MKNPILSTLLLFIFVNVNAQGNRTETLQDLEKNQPSSQEQQITATLKYASRLFESKEDITSVIVIIPAGTVVSVLGSDSTYLKVKSEDNEGYIFKRDATINYTPAEVTPNNQQENKEQAEQQTDQNQVSRFTYLENKYGTSMAARLAEGKIWKGMTAEMVRDSWGNPAKINRVIGNIVKEEWIFKNTWLYIENNILVDWGPIPIRK